MKTNTFSSKRLLPALFLALALPAVFRAAPGGLDPSFVPPANLDHVVDDFIVQPDGKIIVGGWFDNVGGVSTRDGILRLLPGGSLDPDFAPPEDLDGDVIVLTLQPDGKILVGGNFVDAGNNSALDSLMRLNPDGSIDPNFTPPEFNDDVNSISLLTNGKIIVGGDFTNVGGDMDRDKLVRLETDGSLDGDFNPPPFNSTVQDVALLPDGRIFVGGEFTDVDSEMHRDYLVRLESDGTIDATFTLVSPLSSISCLALQSDGKIVVGGNGLLVRVFATGQTDSGFNPPSINSGSVRSLAIQPDGKIIAGGSFTDVSNIVTQDRLMRVHRDGSLDTSFVPPADLSSGVYSLAFLPDGQLLVGGGFEDVGGTLTLDKLIRLDGFTVTPAAPGNYPAASSVLGRPDFTSTETAYQTTAQTLQRPENVLVDPASGKVFVADRNHSRVLRYTSLAAYQTHSAAEFVFGQPDFVSSSQSGGKGNPVTRNGLNFPTGMSIDDRGRLWVADSSNHRVLRYDNAASLTMNGPHADAVFGQSDFVSNDDPGSASAHSDFQEVEGVALDQEGNLYVSDYDLNRVLRFDNANSLISGAALSASAVLGQPDLMSFDGGTSSTALSGPWGIWVDSGGRLWVADSLNHRVLRYDDAANKNTGDPADGVLGQQNFDTANSGLGASVMNNPRAVAVGPDGTLWVSDNNNSRVLGFFNGATKPHGGDADRVIGQPVLDIDTDYLASARDIPDPHGIAIAANGALLIVDRESDRILRFGDAPAINADAPVTNANAAQKAALQKKIKKLKKQLKGARRKKQVARSKRLKGKLKKLQKRLRALS